MPDSRPFAGSLIALLLAGDAHAQPTEVGNEFIANDVTSLRQTDAHACGAGSDFVVAWTDDGGGYGQPDDGRDGSGAGAFARRFDSSNVAVGDSFAVNTYTTGNQYVAGAHCFDDGGFVVVWNQPFGYSGAAQPFFRRFDSPSAPDGDQDLIDDAVGPLTDVCREPGGGFVVVGNHAYYTRLVAKRYDRDGEPIGTSFTVGPQSGGSYGSPTRPSCCGHDDGFIVVWDESGAGSGDLRNVRGQRYDADAAPLGTQFQANTYTGAYQANADVACVASGRFVVAWESGRSASGSYGNETQDGSGFGIAAQRYDTDGSTAGTEFLVNTATNSNQQFATVAMDASGAFLVAWVHNAESFGDSAIRGQAYEASGLPSGTELAISRNGRNLQLDPHASASANGVVTLVWEATELGADDEDVFVRRYSISGGVTTTTMPGGGGVCGDPVDPPQGATSLPSAVTASDALFVLSVAVGIGACEDCVCDVDGSGTVSASDALIVLRFAVGQPVALDCPPC